MNNEEKLRWNGNQPNSPRSKGYQLGDTVLEYNGILFRDSSKFKGCLTVCGYTGNNSLVEVPPYLNYDEHILDVTDIDNGALSENQVIRTLILPESIVTIGDEAFMWSMIEKVSMPGVREMGTNAFMSCPIRTMALPNIKVVEYNAFTSCTFLKTLEIPEGVEIIREGAFFGCNALESIVLPSTLKILEGSAFTDCTSLRSVTFPDNLLVIGYDSFKGCTRLSSITFGKNLAEIENCAFEGCMSLDSVRLPASVKKVAKDAFPKKTKILRDGEPEKRGLFKRFF
ncbi:MAG: leucine-rich repeat protein [Candidatus Methanomethylophilaceae archaeon]|nr:leucine-rich repeat protein [Candidatus Methanomethylophilaceae archaeon]